MPIVQPFDASTNFVFNGEKILNDNSINKLKRVTQIVIYPMVVVLIFTMFGMVFLVLGLMAQFSARLFFSAVVSYQQATRLLIVAATSSMFILLIMLTINKVFPGLGLILLALLTGYFAFAIHAYKQDSKRVVA